MRNLVYVVGVVMALAGASIAIWKTDPSTTLFPGLLSLFSFLLVWTTLEFQLWTKRSGEKRENPRLLVHKGARGLARNAAADSFILCVSNPGTLTGSLIRVTIESGVNANRELKWNWQYLHPLLSMHMGQQPTGSLPLPLLPGSLVVIYTTTAVAVAGEVQLKLTYRMGDNKEKTTRHTI